MVFIQPVQTHLDSKNQTTPNIAGKGGGRAVPYHWLLVEKLNHQRPVFNSKCVLPSVQCDPLGHLNFKFMFLNFLLQVTIGQNKLTLAC